MISSDFREILFVSFGHSPDWDLARKRLAKSIRTNFPHAGTYLVDQRWIQSNPFYEVNRNFFADNPRGFGLWIWKPLLISEAFIRFPGAKYIVYLDMGCELNINPSSVQRLRQYLELSDKNDALAFELNLKEVDWTSERTLEYFSSTKSTSNQIMASVLFFRNNPRCLEFVNEWLANMVFDNFSLTIGERSQSNVESNVMTNHRHDQSILSLMWHKNTFAAIPDETYWGPSWNTGTRFPIWVTRNRELSSVQTKYLIRISSRLLRKFRNLLLIRISIR